MNYDPESVILDEEEQEIEDNIDFSKVLPEAEKQAAIEAFRKAAKSGISKVISLRIDSGMLERIKAQAEVDGLPYQTMIQSIISRYINGSLVDIKAVQEVVKALRAS
jgi:predicted DNA binding CopG/RHH family protein